MSLQNSKYLSIKNIYSADHHQTCNPCQLQLSASYRRRSVLHGLQRNRHRLGVSLGEKTERPQGFFLLSLCMAMGWPASPAVTHRSERHKAPSRMITENETQLPPKYLCHDNFWGSTSLPSQAYTRSREDGVTVVATSAHSFMFMSTIGGSFSGCMGWACSCALETV